MALHCPAHLFKWGAPKTNNTAQPTSWSLPLFLSFSFVYHQMLFLDSEGRYLSEAHEVNGKFFRGGSLHFVDHLTKKVCVWVFYAYGILFLWTFGGNGNTKRGTLVTRYDALVRCRCVNKRVYRPLYHLRSVSLNTLF